MPPNSFCEWAAGRNAPQHLTHRKPRPVFAVQLETDDECESDVLKITYPRTGQAKRQHRKKVRFTDDAHRVGVREPFIQPLLDSDSDASSTAVEVNSSDGEVSTDEDLVLDCPCANCVETRRRLKKTDQTRGRSRRQHVDPFVIGSKSIAAAVHARHKAKKAKEREAWRPRGRSSRRRTKQKAKKVYNQSSGQMETNEYDTGSESDTDDGSGEDTESDSVAEIEFWSERDIHKKRGKNKGRGQEPGRNGHRRRDSYSKKSKHDGERTKKHGHGGRNRSKERNLDRGGRQHGYNRDTWEKEGAYQPYISPEYNIPQQVNETNNQRTQEVETGVQTNLGGANQCPPRNLQYAPQQANFLMPPHPRVLQVEHAVELPNDPRPNAFFDGAHGIMRVYHGPHYGNAYGQLYPNAPYVNQNPTVNVSYPIHNPWQAAGLQSPPPLPPQQQPLPPHGHFQQPPAANRRAQGENPWFQGYGSVTVGKPLEETQEANFSPGNNHRNNGAWSEQNSTPTRPAKSAEINSRSDRVGKSNVIPSIEVIDSEKPRGGRGTRNKPWGTQGAHGSQKASESKEERNNDSKDTDKVGNSGQNESFDDVIARAEALYKTNSERFSPIPPNDNNETGNGTFGDNNDGGWGGTTGWGDGNDATAGDNSWGEKDAQETATCDADASKPTEGNSNDNSSGPAGGNASVDNVVHGEQTSSNNNTNGNSNGSKNGGDNGSGGNNDVNNGGNKGGKRSKADPKRGTPTRGPPGCWVSNPPSENEDAKPPSGQDNVGPHTGGNSKKDKGKGKQKGKGKPENNQASGSGSGNGNGNDSWGGNANWGDPGVAQSSGGAFDNDDDENKDGKEQQGVEW
ncbi:hypothetical protein F4811DRAFT_246090 [Daldinia bambusicola]|nr:hypothetical protein F4811DRAFT_246090 [Daldinia bambusicola]